MKHTQVLAKIVATVAVIAVLITSAVVLFACNRKKTVTINDIFKSATSDGEFTSYITEITLPVGWEVYTTSKSSSKQADDEYSDVGYIKDMEAFVVMNSSSKNLSIVKCGQGERACEMLFEEYLGIKSLRAKCGLIICKFDNGELGAFDYNGKTVLSRGNFKDVGTSISIDSAIKILDSGLIAVHHAYDKFGAPTYTSIYRPTLNADSSKCGELICRVSNTDNALSRVRGFDGKYVTVVGNSVGDVIYNIPNTPQRNGSNIVNMSGTPSSTFVSKGQKDYYNEILYIGKGKFFVYEESSVSETDEYGYYDGEKYYVFSRYIYTPDNDTLTEYKKNEDKIFLNMSNNYYTDKISIDTNAYLNDGYIYASYGLSCFDGEWSYDQYILDSDLNIVMSLTGNYGVTIKGQKKDKIGFYDLIMTKVDGYFYIPLQPSEVRFYDESGKLVGKDEDGRSTVMQQELNNNVIIAAIPNPDDEDEMLYGAFNIKGEVIIEFKYFFLSAFRGNYTIGQHYNDDNVKTMCIVGNDGNVIAELEDGSMPLVDIASTGNANGNKPIYTIGCYVFKNTEKIIKDGKEENVTFFGIKNFNVEANIVMPATMSAGVVLYTPPSSPSDVFVFEKHADENGANVSYTIHRLI